MAEAWHLKTYRIEISPRVLRDLERAKREVFAACQSEEVTTKYLRKIASEIELLEIFPDRFPFWRDRKKHHFLIAAKYLVFFQIRQFRVLISHIRYAGRTPFSG